MAGEWSWTTLGDISINRDAMRVPVRESDRKAGPYRYYGASGVVDHVDGYLFDGEYLLVAEDGENLRTRQTPVAFIAKGQFWVNNHAHILEGNQHALTRFLNYALAIADIDPFLTGAVMPKLTQSNLHRIPIFLPSRDEQEQIVELLGALDDKIELHRRMAETLEAMARALFKSWFVDFDPVHAKAERQPTGLPNDLAVQFPDRLREDGLPLGWEFRSVDELLDVNPRTFLPAGTEAPYVDMAALPTHGARVRSFIKRPAGSGSRFQNDDTLVARITPCLENGKTAIVDFLTNEQVVGWGSTEFIVLRPSAGVPPAWPYLLAKDDSFRAHLIASMSGTSGRQRVPPSAVSRWEMAIPTKAVLKAFGSVTTPIFERIRALDIENDSLAALRDTLLPKLISGELRIADAEKRIVAA